MGGGSTPDLGAVAKANQLNVFDMDDLTRNVQESYIQKDPQHRNPSDKKLLFLLEIRKYQSKIRDMIKEKEDYLAKFRPIIESVVDKAGRFDNPLTLTQEEVRSQMKEVEEEFSEVKKKLTNKKYENLNRRLRYTAKRCCTMVERVSRTLKLMANPEKNPAWKRVLNPELDLQGPTSIAKFIYVGRLVQDEVDRVFYEGDKLRCDLLEEHNKHIWRIVDLDRQAMKNIMKKIRALERKAQQDTEELEPKRRRTE